MISAKSKTKLAISKPPILDNLPVYRNFQFSVGELISALSHLQGKPPETLFDLCLTLLLSCSKKIQEKITWHPAFSKKAKKMQNKSRYSKLQKLQNSSNYISCCCPHLMITLLFCPFWPILPLTQRQVSLSKVLSKRSLVTFLGATRGWCLGNPSKKTSSIPGFTMGYPQIHSISMA